MTIGKLQRVPLREVWRHEAADFTTWLESNVDVLNEVLDFTITSVEREKSAGDFNVDLVGEDETGGVVVIENQLERSNHDHLGKLLTYLAALDAGAAIWIVASPRPEHARAIAWLNESTSTPFYLVQVEAVAIGDSPPAPLFTVIARPSEEARAAGLTKQGLSERQTNRHAFWSLLLERARTKTKLHSNISPSMHNFIGAGAGLSGLAFNYAVRQHECQAELYIDFGDQERNKAVFETLAENRATIEEAFGGPLDWQRLEGRRASRIRVTLPGGWRDEEAWPEVVDRLSTSMARLEAAFRPYIQKLRA